jgi:hypothetical protein
LGAAQFLNPETAIYCLKSEKKPVIHKTREGFTEGVGNVED